MICNPVYHVSIQFSCCCGNITPEKFLTVHFNFCYLFSLRSNGTVFINLHTG